MNRILIFFATCLTTVSPCAFGDQLTLTIDGKDTQLTGEILITAQDDSLYFQGNDGKIWFVKPGQIKHKSDDDLDVPPITKTALGKNLLAELPEGFRIFETKHYVIAYQNEVAYARWIGGLYESRLYRGFETFWEKKHKLPLHDPPFPLAAIIFGSAAEYNQHVVRELGEGQSMVAYYNLLTNRVTMYDLTADLRNPNQDLNDRKIDQILQTPSAIPMVATIIHEGTHQLMFNRGMQTRFADSPLWLNEGLAMFFETPDARSSRGWRVPGLFSPLRMTAFRNYFPRRTETALETMIQSDERFRDPELVADAYAQAWAFNHFLLNKHAAAYTEYLKHMSTKTALLEDSPDSRLSEFQEFLGQDMRALDEEFIEYMRNLK
jgi:hypothetical protein